MSVKEVIDLVEIAQARDAEACGRLMDYWIEETDWIPRLHSAEQAVDFLADLIGRGWVTLVRREGKAVGFLAREGAEIHALYLAPPVRGQGIGKMLLDHAKAQEKQLGLWTFQANIPAQRFYLREGFSEVRRSQGEGNDEGLPDIRYEWRRFDGRK